MHIRTIISFIVGLIIISTLVIAWSTSNVGHLNIRGQMTNNTDCGSHDIYNFTNANGTNAYITNLNVSGDMTMNSNWTNNQNYPSQCPEGSTIKQLGDSVTCIDEKLQRSGDQFGGDFDGMRNNLENFTNISALNFDGQPLHGIANKGLIYIEEYSGGLLNVTENTTHVFYPDFKAMFRDGNDNLVYCDISRGNIQAINAEARIGVINSSCDVSIITTTEYLDLPEERQRISRVPFFYVLSGDEGIELLYGEPQVADVMQLIRGQSIYLTHLDVINGMAISEGTFPELIQSAGRYVFDVHMALPTAQNTTKDGILLRYHQDTTTWNSSNGTSMNLTHCDNGTTLIECSSNQFRRYVFYTLGRNTTAEDRTQMNQLAAVDSEEYVNIGECLDIIDNPISYTLPTPHLFAAVVTHIYCGQRDDSSFSGSWMDRRFSIITDTSIYITRDGERNLTANWDAGEVNITSSNVFIQSDISLHTDSSQSVASIGTWYNISFIYEATIYQGINHTYDDVTNDTITIVDSGVYDIKYEANFNDTSAVPDDYIYMRIVVNGEELIGSGEHEYVSKQYAHVTVKSGCPRAELTVGDKVKIQFTGTSTNTNLESQGGYIEHADSARVCLKRIR